MGYSVELYFDNISEISVSRYLKLFNKTYTSDHDLSNIPHISIAVYKDSLDIKELTKMLGNFHLTKFKLLFNHIGIFNTSDNCIFIESIITDDLLNLHNQYHLEFIKFRNDLVNYYLPNKWVPH